MNKIAKPLALLALVLVAPGVAAADDTNEGARATFTNPIVTGADPWVVRWEGDYVFCQSRLGGIAINRAKRLEDIGKGEWSVVWRPPAGTEHSKELWAPELHYVRGKWYVYVAADDGKNEHHRMYVLEGTSQNPRDPFVFKGQLKPTTDRWAIDGTVLELPGDRLYFVWSGWEGTENVAQNLYIAAMSDPMTISGERVLISRPEFEWEKRGSGGGLPTINEGPEALKNGDKVFIIYSASGSWGDDYCLGQLTWTGGDPLDPASWVKRPEPVFSRTKDVFGPGHCSFTKSPDGKEDWIVYHAAKHRGAGWDRDVRIQKFTWKPDGSPDLGRPVSPGVPLGVPSGESTPR
jgi:GH43 family beta-xylosidase